MPHNAVTEIGILIYPDSQLAGVHGLTDLFVEASRISRDLGGAEAPVLRVTHWEMGREMGRDAVERVFDTHPAAASRPVVLIAPPTLKGPPKTPAAMVAWLRARHAAGTTVCSVCGGTFVLAEAGLLQGRVVTTHWNWAGELAERYPDIHVDADRLIIDDGDIVTAGGLMAWTDLGLRLIDRFLGPSVMVATARFFLIDPADREQRFYSSFSPRLHHGDEAILKVQHWLQKDGGRNADTAAMAGVAGLEGRTFLRRFRKATGFNPTEYCQRLRVGKAREMLELTGRTIDQVAWDVGYEDPASFRKVFQKVTGLRPREYRRRFSVAGGAGGEEIGTAPGRPESELRMIRI
ncbi:MAG TPA: GlxA family transcriptional regulator [Rhodopila sp.]|uniref:GlxA family transcriptional regulator n=1 Tax=Rhodopila sp. TaxID=2480087 RepID=UPI002D189699|nr:GlxA family transcriptional regulator [Rhodopila sp.]HVY17259.1 GlxA family transcriptional regulator [Rhodopila sp.]